MGDTAFHNGERQLYEPEARDGIQGRDAVHASVCVDMCVLMCVLFYRV